MPEPRPDPPPAPRGPWNVPDEYGGLGAAGGVDTDGDGVPDTVVVDDGFDLLVATDLDGDGIADQVLRLAADGSVHPVEPPDPSSEPPPWSPTAD